MVSKRQSDNDPEQSSETGPATNKRRRIGLACNACRVRKSRCDGQRPSCSSCLSLGLDCVYEPGDSATNVIVRKDYVSDLEQRVTSVEHNLQRLNDVLKGHLSPCTNNNHTNTNNGASPAHQPHIAHSITVASPRSAPHTKDTGAETCATGLEEPHDEDASTNGMAMTFIEEKTSAFYGEASNINFTQLLFRAVATVHQATPAAASSTIEKASALGEGVVASLSQAQNIGGLSTPLELSPTALPSVEEMDSLLDIYFETAGVVFPFIHQETMRKTYSECRLNGFTRARRTWLGTLNMIFAFASSFDRGDAASAKKRFERSNVFYKRAIALCGELSKRVISLEIVHYLILVVLHCQGTQRSVQAWNNHGLVIRSAMALGLHSDSSGKGLDPIQQEYRRRTWVVIYCLDKVLSTAFGRPASIPDEQAVRGNSVFGLSPSSPNGQAGVDLPGDFLAVSFKLYQVMSKSLISQYGANLDHADADHDEMAPLKASGELRKQLRLWAASLPPHLQLCEPGDEFLARHTQENRLRVILTLRYHNLGILIHKPLLSATIRHLFAGESGTGPSPSYMIHLVMAEAHECIRSAELTIDIAHSVISADPTSKNNLGAWFFTLYYVFTASLVIIGLLLWAQHGQGSQGVVDEAAASHAKSLLRKAENIFLKLDHENNLVLSCLEYIRRLARMCSAKEVGPAQVDKRSEAASSLNAVTDTSLSASGSADTMNFSVDDMDSFQLFASEMFDPSKTQAWKRPGSFGRYLGSQGTQRPNSSPKHRVQNPFATAPASLYQILHRNQLAVMSDPTALTQLQIGSPPRYTKTQLQDYLKVIKLPQKFLDSPVLKDPTLARSKEHGFPLLNAITRYHLCNIPFENLELHYSAHKTITLDPYELFAKFVERRRGGRCMENNTFLGVVLRSLGYEVRDCGGRVSRAMSPYKEVRRNQAHTYDGWNHMLNLAHLDEEWYVVDVGMGSMGPNLPYPLHDGFETTSIAPRKIRLQSRAIAESQSGNPRTATKLWCYDVCYNPGQDGTDKWTPVYAFTETEFLPQDYEVMSWFTSTNPRSFFTRYVTCTKMIMDEEKEVIIGNNTLFVDTIRETIGDDRKVLRECKTEAERIQALEEIFDVRLTEDEKNGLPQDKRLD
ncbi:transcription factor [Fusarium avenaceum]|nr:transcription factor [Fusarium avenaceum]